MDECATMNLILKQHFTISHVYRTRRFHISKYIVYVPHYRFIIQSIGMKTSKRDSLHCYF